MTYPLTFPASLSPIRASRPRLQNPSRGGGPSTSGSEQVVVAPGGGRWTWSLTFDLRGRRDLILDMDAFVIGMAGRAGTAIVPIFDGQRAPWNFDPLTGGPITPAKAAASAAIDPAFATNPATTGTLAFALAADATLNATSLTIARSKGGLVRPGMLCSIGTELHAVTAIDAPDEGATSTRRITILPWLRADRAAGTAIEFAHPVCRARFASDDTGKLDLEMLRYGQVTLDFVEDA